MRLGHWATTYRHIVPHVFMLLVVAATAYKTISSLRDRRPAALDEFRGSLPVVACFSTLMGMHHLVSNGRNYADMATNYWTVDPSSSTSRRIGMPALSHVLGMQHGSYAVFWYAILFSALCLANAYMARKGLFAVERLSILSSSTFAYAMVGPGYSEIFVVLLGLYCLLNRPGLVQRIVIAALMVATHETATVFIALALIVEADDTESFEWLLVLAALYAAYVAAFALNWRFDLLQALTTAGKESPTGLSTSDWLVAYPWRAALGVFIAYKLYWIPALAGWSHRLSSVSWMATAASSSLLLVPIGTDTSRLVQFGSLALIVCLSAVLPSWSQTMRRRLAMMNLAIPSLYIAINAEPLWGNGLYALYLDAARHAGFFWGRIFFR